MKKRAKIPDKICVVCDCGAGDFYRSYFTSRKWRVIKAIKEKYPNTKVKALIATSNTQPMEILSFSPYVDSMTLYPWSCKEGNSLLIKHPKYFPMTNTSSMSVNIKPSISEPKIALSQKDREFISSLSLKKFVFIHPFSGNTRRV